MQDWMENILDAVRDVVPADLAAILELDGEDALKVVAARGPLAQPQLLGHLVSLAGRPALQQAMLGPGPTVLDAAHKEGDEPDPYAKMVPLPGDHSCLAVPLRDDSAALLGAMTLDFRQCGVFESETILASVAAFARLAGQALGAQFRADRLNKRLHSLAAGRPSGPDLAPEALLPGRSPAWRATLDRIRLAAPTGATVLLLGETGTGKERAARALHAWSDRASGPFVAVNCSVLQGSLVLSDLFGHERGSFTGAATRRLGRFELADGGTLFLDEIADLPAEAQALLLRVIEEGTFERVGGARTIRVDVRLLAATHKNLEAEVEVGRFRRDLYYRLSAFPIRLPSLRERPGDVLLLAAVLLREIETRLKMPVLRMSEDAARLLESHDWPGNVRELANALERAAILAGGATISSRHLELPQGPSTGKLRPLAQDPRLPTGLSPLDRAKALVILDALDASGGKVSGPRGAAERLELPPTTLWSMMKRLGLRNQPD